MKQKDPDGPHIICPYKINSLPFFQRKIFRLFQTEIAHDNSNFYENGRMFSQQVENNVGKGEIARYEQFLLFTVFSKDLYCRHAKTLACLGKS